MHWHGPIDLPSNMDPEGARSDGFWVVLGHPEITEINRDWERFRAADGPTLVAFPPQMRGTALIWMDPPDHTRLRKLVSAGFTPRMLRRLDELLVRRADRILDAVAERGEFDFVSEVAYQLPMHVIADIVGIPEDERPYVFELTDRMLKGLDPRLFGDVRRKACRPGSICSATPKSSAPASNVSRPMTSGPSSPQASVTTEDGSRDQAGRSSSSTSSSSSWPSRAARPRATPSPRGWWRCSSIPISSPQLRADPGLLDTAVEEIIRWSSPVLYFGRTAEVDAEIGGAQIRAGDRVTLWYPAGNRDERAFDDPYRFDIRRSPNPHVSFGGGGAHYCLGANLAKREVHVMMQALMHPLLRHRTDRSAGLGRRRRRRECRRLPQRACRSG